MDSSDAPYINAIPNKTNQKKPYHSHENLCTMPNLGNTCTFNSFIQSLAASKYSKRIIEKKSLFKAYVLMSLSHVQKKLL